MFPLLDLILSIDSLRWVLLKQAVSNEVGFVACAERNSFFILAQMKCPTEASRCAFIKPRMEHEAGVLNDVDFSLGSPRSRVPSLSCQFETDQAAPA